MITEDHRPADPPGPAPRQVALDTERLYAALDRERRRRRLTRRALLREIGEHSPSALTRLGQGTQPSADLLVRYLHWLRTTDLGPFLAYLTPEGAAASAVAQGRQAAGATEATDRVSFAPGNSSDFMAPGAVQAHLTKLDGSSASAVSLLSGVPVDQLPEYGGLPEEETL